MPARIRLAGWSEEAECISYSWHADDPELVELLNVTLQAGGPDGHDPNPDYTAAKRAIDLFGGEMLSYVKTRRPTRSGDEIY